MGRNREGLERLVARMIEEHTETPVTASDSLRELTERLCDFAAAREWSVSLAEVTGRYSRRRIHRIVTILRTQYLPSVGTPYDRLNGCHDLRKDQLAPWPLM